MTRNMTCSRQVIFFPALSAETLSHRSTGDVLSLDIQDCLSFGYWSHSSVQACWRSFNKIGNLVTLLHLCVCVCVLWSVCHMVVQLCADMITKAWPDVPASCLWHRLFLFMYVCMSHKRQHIVLMPRAGSETPPLLTQVFQQHCGCACRACVSVS